MNEPITITIVPELLCTGFILVLFGGSLAGLLVRGGRATVLTSIIAGMVGGVIGAMAGTLLQVEIPEAIQGGLTVRYIDLIVVFMGALVAVVFDRLVRRDSPRKNE